MTGKNMVREGYLLAQSNKEVEPEWEKKYFVFYKASDKNKSRLDWYDNEEAYKKSPTLHKTIFLEEVTDVKLGKQKLKGAKVQVLEIYTTRRKEPFKYSGEGLKISLSDWCRTLEKQLKDKEKHMSNKRPHEGAMGEDIYVNEVMDMFEKSQDFPLTVVDTDTSKKCGLKSDEKYTLRVFSKYIALYDNQKATDRYMWPIKYIRRFGRSANNFTFESGRKCASGEGVFMFLSVQAEEIFQALTSCQKGLTSDRESAPAVPEKKGCLLDDEIDGNQSRPLPPPKPPGLLKHGPQGVPDQIYSEVANMTTVSIDTGYDEPESGDGYAEPVPVVNPNSGPPPSMSAILAQMNIASNVDQGEPGGAYYDHIPLHKTKSRGNPAESLPTGHAAASQEEATYDEIGHFKH